MPTIKDIIIRKPSQSEIDQCRDWPIWQCQPSTFDWIYTQTETCLIITGTVTISEKSSNDRVSFGEGDFVIFPIDLECVWQIDAAVKKHYSFS